MVYTILEHFFVVKQSSRILTKEEIKNLLLDLFVCNENINKEDLSTRVYNEDCQKAVENIEEYENTMKTNKKNIIRFAFEQGKMFEKFKEDKKFKNLVEQLK